MGGNVNEEYGEYTIDEIINGKVNDLFSSLFYCHRITKAAVTDSACSFLFFGQGDSFPGLIGLVETYIGTLDLSDSESRKISSYLDLVRRRANGSLKTAATWIRDFVRSHPSYKFDSVVNKEINYDLIVAVDEM